MTKVSKTKQAQTDYSMIGAVGAETTQKNTGELKILKSRGNHRIARNLFIVVVVMLIGMTSVFAQEGGKVGKLTWSLEEGVLTISGKGKIPKIKGAMYIPWYKHSDSINTIVISSGVTRIKGMHMFYFSGVHMFYFSLRRLTSINVESGNKVYASEDGVLFNKNKTKLILYPYGKTGDYIVPNNVKTIGEAAFSSCSLTSITISKNVKRIGYNNHGFCSLTFITCLNPVPVPIRSGIYEKCPCILKVPVGSVEAYKKAKVWKEFKNIVGE